MGTFDWLAIKITMTWLKGREPGLNRNWPLWAGFARYWEWDNGRVINDKNLTQITCVLLKWLFTKQKFNQIGCFTDDVSH